MTRKDLEALELRLLLEAVHTHYGYDFRTVWPEDVASSPLDTTKIKAGMVPR